MLRVEISKAFHRPRTYVLAVLLAAVAVLRAIVLATTNDAGGGPPFFDLIRRNGLLPPWPRWSSSSPSSSRSEPACSLARPSPPKHPAGPFVTSWSVRSAERG